MRYLVYSFLVVLLFAGCGQDYYDLDFDKSSKTKKKKKAKPKAHDRLDETIDNSTMDQDDVKPHDDVEDANDLLDEKLLKKQSIDNPSFDSSVKNKMALIYSSKTIGKYAINATSSAMAYLLSRNQPFDLEVFDMPSQTTYDIQTAFQKAKKNGHKNIVAILTNSSYNNLLSYSDIDEFKIYLPLINKNNVLNLKDNIIYGGLDYAKQLKVLSKKTVQQAVEYYSQNTLGKILHDNTVKIDPKVKYSQPIGKGQKSYNSLISTKKWLLKGSSIYLNTSSVPSSIILSTIKAKRIRPANILSTQVNYTPMLLSLTGANALRGLTIANSIKPIDPATAENIALLGGDIWFNWISYSTVVGVDYFLDSNRPKIEPNVLDGQVDFDVKLYKAVNGSFVQSSF